MKTRIFVSVALAGLLGFNLVGCGSQPRTSEELSKLPIEELKKMKEDCNMKQGEIIGELKKSNLYEVAQFKGGDEIAKIVEADPSKFSKEFVECYRAWSIKDKN